MLMYEYRFGNDLVCIYLPIHMLGLSRENLLSKNVRKASVYIMWLAVNHKFQDVMKLIYSSINYKVSLLPGQFHKQHVSFLLVSELVLLAET